MVACQQTKEAIIIDPKRVLDEYKKQQMQKDLKSHKRQKHIFMLILPRVSVTLPEFSALNCTYPMKAMKIGSIRMSLKRLYFLKREILSTLVKSN
jgi:hypothetical protein